MKKTRQAKWEACRYCVFRGVEPVFRSGKRKCLERHMVKCKLAHETEQAAERVSTPSLLREVESLKTLCADLASRVKVLELKRDRYYVQRNAFWEKLSPKLCWKRAKENVKRAIRSMLKTFKPKPWRKCKYQWLEDFYKIGNPELHDVLSLALWPVLQEDGNFRTVLRGPHSTDLYCMFKRVWGKTYMSDLSFYEEAIVELGLPEQFHNKKLFQKLNDEFVRILSKFQRTQIRAGHKRLPQGIVALCRIWDKMYPIAEDVFTVATSLGPNETLTLESEAPLDPPQKESEEARADNTSF